MEKLVRRNNVILWCQVLFQNILFVILELAKNFQNVVMKFGKKEEMLLDIDKNVMLVQTHMRILLEDNVKMIVL